MKSFLVRSFAIIVLICSLQDLSAQTVLHDTASAVNDPVDVTIDEKFAPFGNRPETDKAGDDGSYIVRDRNGAMLWSTRDGKVNVLPNATLAKALYVSNSEALVFENRFQREPVRFDTPNFSSTVAIHRLNDDGTINTRTAVFNGETLIDTVPISPTTYGYTLVTARYSNENLEESIYANGPGDWWGECTYTLYRLTWTSTTDETTLDTQLLKSITLDVPRNDNESVSSVLADTRVLGFGNDGAFVFNRSIGRARIGGAETRVASFLVTFNIDFENVTRVPLTDPDSLPMSDIVFVDNTSLVAAAPIPILIGFDIFGFPLYGPSGNYTVDEYRTRANGTTILSSSFALDAGERVLNTNPGLYFRRGFPKNFYTLANSDTEIRLNIIGTGLQRLGAGVALPTAIQPDNIAVRNARDSALLVRAEGTVGILWVPTVTDANGFATSIDSIRTIADSSNGKPMYVSSDEAVIWMNGDDSVDISEGAEIPPAEVVHVSKNGAGVLVAPLQIEGRYIASPLGVSNDAETEGWFITSFEKLRSDSRAARVRTYRLYSGDILDSDKDGLSDNDERFVYFTDPENPDTDGDGLNDGKEVRPYELIIGLFTWEEARKDALKRGGILARFQTTEKQEGLNFILGKAIRSRTDAAWVGASDILTEGQYRWVTNTGYRGGAYLPTNPDHPTNNWDRPFHPNNLLDADGMVVMGNKNLTWRMLSILEKYPYLIEFIGSDPLDRDTDRDGLTDGEERGIGSDPTKEDTDGDGLTDKEEFDLGTSPFLVDTDGDGLTDFEEVRKYNTDPLLRDTDGDGLDDGEEITRGTNPRNRDTDSDELVDGDEVRLGTNPLKPDTDNDGLTDGREVKLGTNPLKPDTDGDGLKDGDEVNNGTDPLDKRDPKGLDSDNDGLTDYEEIFIYGTNPDNKDTDGDGLTDFEELRVYGTNPLRKDTDRDGISDYDEVHVTFTDPNKPSTGGATPPSTTGIPFGSANVQGSYQGIVVSARGGQTFKQTITITSGGRFSTKLVGLRSGASFKGAFSEKGVYTGRPDLTQDLKSVRLVVVETDRDRFSVQGTYESRSGGKYYVELHKVGGGMSTTANRKVTLDTKNVSGKGPKGSIVGLGWLQSGTKLNLNFYLPDGSRSSSSSPVLRGKRVCLYARSSDPSEAVLMGMLKIRDVKDVSDFDGLVRLYSSQNRAGTFYPSGYDQQREIRGAYYRNPAPGELPVEGFRIKSNNAAYQWIGGDFDGVNKAGTWTSDGKMVIPTNQNDSVTNYFDKKTGLLKMTYKRTDTARELTDASSYVVAVVQQKADTFRGYYVSDGSAASFRVVPNTGIVDADITSISPRNKTMSAAGGTYTVTVKTKGEWTVELPTGDLTDINNIRVTAIINSGGVSGTPDEVKGNGNGTVTFTVSPNSSYSRLVAYIMIAGVKHELTQEFR